jgi:hypothetical protein
LQEKERERTYLRKERRGEKEALLSRCTYDEHTAVE